MPFLYWWDVTPSMADRLAEYEIIEFACKDTGLRCKVPVSQLKGLLLPERQTSRSDGNWGVRVLQDREDELAFEPGTGSGGDWLFFPVVWTDQQI